MSQHHHHHLPSPKTDVSDMDEHETLCHHDHEHDGLKTRYQQNSHSGSETDERSISLPAASRHAGQTVAPFLARHIPTQYNPLGSLRQTQIQEDDSLSSSTKFCYRHRPDLKCRRQVNEPSMEQLQNVSAY